MSKDNWDLTTGTRICVNCEYYINMRCRRHAPTLAGYPAVYPDDWCGDFKFEKTIMKKVFGKRYVPTTEV